MVAADGVRVVMVLSPRPDDVGPVVVAPGLETVHAPGVDELLAALPGRLVSGFALDVDMVLRAPAAQRELLYHLALAFPLLRLRRKGRSVAFLDDPAGFCAAALGFAPRAARRQPRAAVFLHGLLAAPPGVNGGDGGQGGEAAPLPADILDVSCRGGLLSASRPLEGDLSLRILDLSDQRPLTARVCWRRPPGRGPRHGAGVRFVDIRPGQAEELAERFLLRGGGKNE